jgi:hypothetical protein
MSDGAIAVAALPLRRVTAVLGDFMRALFAALAALDDYSAALSEHGDAVASKRSPSRERSRCRTGGRLGPSP